MQMREVDLNARNWKARFPALLFLSALFVAASIPAGAQNRTAAANSICDRSCLEGFINQYLDALVKHDPRSLPVAPGVKFTENAAPLKLGQGLWRTATGLGSYKLYAEETSQGQVAVFAVIRENDVPALLFLRLKVNHRKIGEVETIVVRKIEQPFLDTSAMTKPRPIFTQTVPANQRSSRAQMIAIANQYFDAIEHSNGNLVPLAKDSIRVENGIQTCNKPSQGGHGFDLGALGCAAQLSTGYFSYIESIDPRRIVIVDEERGLVLGIFRFNHPGTVKSVNIPGVGKVDEKPMSQHPYGALIAEMFKIQGGKILEITAAFPTVTYRIPTGWDK